MKRFLLLGACVAALLPAGARCEWTLDASTTFVYDDNVSNSLEAEDRKADGSLAATVSGGIYETLGSSTSLGLSLIAEPATYLRYSGLNNLALGASARLRQKFGLGDAPSAVFSVQALHRDYHYTIEMDGSTTLAYRSAGNSVIAGAHGRACATIVTVQIEYNLWCCRASQLQHTTPRDGISVCRRHSR